MCVWGVGRRGREEESLCTLRVVVTGCMESLWSLSFNAENQEDMMKDTKLLDLVIKVYRDDSDPCHSAAAGMLFQLREHLQKHYRKDYNDVGEFSLERYTL